MAGRGGNCGFKCLPPPGPMHNSINVSLGKTIIASTITRPWDNNFYLNSSTPKMLTQSMPGPRRQSSGSGKFLKTIPHKRRDSAANRKLKFHSSSCSASAVETSAFPKLDLSKPEHKRRLDQRRKMISYGKNTMGYDAYIRQVPKEKRRKRNMETPMTPDYTLDIPNKRWMGQVRAWRRALHNYDPPDLQKSLTLASDDMQAEAPKETNSEISNSMSVQEKEIAEAKTKGLLVDLGQSNTTEDGTSSSSSPIGMNDSGSSEMLELDRWDSVRDDSGIFCSDEEDSDDELL